VFKDAATGWIARYPLPDKSSEAATKALMEFAGNSTVTLFYSDSAPELISAAQAMGWPHERATPGRPQTNGVAERAVRTVLDGTRSALLHAGFEERYWSLACQHWCFAHNVQYDKLGNTPWMSRLKAKFLGQLLPFGVLIDFLPSPIAADIPKFAPRAIPGLFIGWRVHTNGKWRNEYLVASMSQIDVANQGKRLELQTVLEVYHNGDYAFP
jgi:hypothetical protein